MDHIKNSPNLHSDAVPEPQNPTPALSLNLDHPNAIGDFTPWQIDFRQLDPGRLTTNVTVRMGRSVSALNIAMNQRVHQRGASPAGWTTLGIPVRDAVASWKGKNLIDNAFLSFGDSDGFDGVTTAQFAGNVISLETSRLQELAQSCGFHLDDKVPAVRETTTDAGLASLSRLERGIKNLLTVANAEWTPATEENLMLEALAMLTDSDAHLDKSQAETRRRALNRAIDLMFANLDDPVSIEEICKQCGASWRTLDRAFKEHFGHGPKAYYLRLRLDRVREDLLMASQDDSISEVANRNGFWHMGQFAKDYRLFFGELPSGTRSQPSDRQRPSR